MKDDPVGIYDRPSEAAGGSGAGRTIAVILALVVLAVLAYLLIQYVF